MRPDPGEGTGVGIGIERDPRIFCPRARGVSGAELVVDLHEQAGLRQDEAVKTKQRRNGPRPETTTGRESLRPFP